MSDDGSNRVIDLVIFQIPSVRRKRGVEDKDLGG